MTMTDGETLRFATGHCALGGFLLAMGETGVAAILLGDDNERLLRELGRSFPGVKLRDDAAGLADALARVGAFLDAPGKGLDLPLDIRGSELERAVWAALRAVPVGETASYGQIAKRLPLAATAQEVGAACAANRIAVAIPCHRIVKADGSISGYRWGVERKRRLINREAVL